MPGMFSSLNIYISLPNPHQILGPLLSPLTNADTETHRGSTGLNPCLSVEYELDNLTFQASVFICEGKNSMVLRLNDWKISENSEKVRKVLWKLWNTVQAEVTDEQRISGGSWCWVLIPVTLMNYTQQKLHLPPRASSVNITTWSLGSTLLPGKIPHNSWGHSCLKIKLKNKVLESQRVPTGPTDHPSLMRNQELSFCSSAQGTERSSLVIPQLRRMSKTWAKHSPHIATSTSNRLRTCS